MSHPIPVSREWTAQDIRGESEAARAKSVQLLSELMGSLLALQSTIMELRAFTDEARWRVRNFSTK